jgi:hypothetical protein
MDQGPPDCARRHDRFQLNLHDAGAGQRIAVSAGRPGGALAILTEDGLAKLAAAAPASRGAGAVAGHLTAMSCPHT